MTDNKLLKAAIKYAKIGLAVFPVRPESKRPHTPNGCKDAKTDLMAIKAWWKRWPDANIGIATGSISGGVIVIDLDVDDDKGINGYDSLREWERENGELPETWQAITGRGGYHLYFKHPNAEKVTNRAGILDGVDVRGEGGYVVAPPSIHQNGSEYEWEYDPDEYPLATANEIVFKLLSTGSKRERDEFIAPAVIEDGKRNDTLFKLASSLQTKGLADQAIMEAVKAQNAASCVHPLDDTEVEQIVSSAIQYKKGELEELINVNNGEKYRGPSFSTYTDRVGNPKVKQTIENIVEAIEYDKDLWRRIRYNSLAYAPYVYSNLPWTTDNGRKFREWTNNDDANLKSYIESKYGFKSLDKIMEALKIVSFKYKYNPVADLLEQCYAEWDGQPHIENLLPDFLGVEKNDYSIGVMNLVMQGAIHRAYVPGCKFDYTMILWGSQGIGKSTFIRYLAMSDEWFNDNFNTMDGDKAAEKLRGMWIIELAELLAAKKAKEVESIKAFLTSRSDTYRPPYERRTEQRPRSCIFIGTTNSNHFLTDRTGNRRFLPIITDVDRVKKSLFEDELAARFEFAQAWGEAVSAYHGAGGRPTLVLPKSLLAMAEEMQSRFLEEDARIGIIQDFLDHNETITRVCVPMIWKEALKMDRPMTKSDSNQLHEIMMNDIRGWRRVENKNNGRTTIRGYGTQICYDRAFDRNAIKDIIDTQFGNDDEIFR